MVEYGVIVTNKFHFLSDDEGADPSEILDKASEIKKTKGTTITKVPQAVAAETKVNKPEVRVANKENDGNRGRGRGRGRGTGERRQERRPENQEGAVDGGFRGRGRGNRGGNFGERRGGRRSDGGETVRHEGEERVDGERRPRGRGGLRRGGARGDRVSGSDRTGVRPVTKRDGYGKGNWGTTEDEVKGETEPIVEQETEKAPEADEAVEKTDSATEAEKEEEKPVGMTLSEWKELHKNTSDNFNVRKANDDKKLNLAPMKKDHDDNKEAEEFVVLRREPREKHVDINVNFGGRGGYRAERGERFERGDRIERGGRGGRGRGQDRGFRGGNRGNNQSFNLSNEQFPALGGH